MLDLRDGIHETPVESYLNLDNLWLWQLKTLTLKLSSKPLLLVWSAEIPVMSTWCKFDITVCDVSPYGTT